MDEAAYSNVWTAGSNGGYWYVTRHPDSRGGEALTDKTGRRYRRFKSREAAQRAADEANKKVETGE